MNIAQFLSLDRRDREIVTISPWAVFLAVAAADGTVDDKEKAAFEQLLVAVRSDAQDLMGEVVRRLLGPEGSIDVQSLIQSTNAIDILLRTGALVRGAGNSEEAEAFMNDLFALGQRVAEASGGLFGIFGSRISDAERRTLETVRMLLRSAPPVGPTSAPAKSDSAGGWRDAVKLSPDPSPVDGARFDFRKFILCDNLPFGDYPMWCSSPGDVDFETSPILPIITQVFEAFDGYQTCVFGEFAYSFALIKSPGRVRLPEELEFWPLRSREGTVFVVSASEEKGVRFHFGKDKRSIAERNKFWREVADWAVWFRGVLEGGGIAPDDHSVARPLEWWRNICRINAEAIRSQMRDEKVTSSEHAVGVFFWHPNE